MAKNQIQNLLVTHIMIDELPLRGMKRLQYFTATKESYPKGEYYWGASLATKYSSEQLKKIVSNHQAIALPEPVLLDTNSELWLNAEGEVYKAGFVNPNKDCIPVKIFKPFSKAKAALKGLAVPKIQPRTKIPQ